MIRDLRLFKYVDGANDLPFPDAENQISIGSYEYIANRMGDAPRITAKIMYPRSLDSEWTSGIYAEFRGERYFIVKVPSSEKNNGDIRYMYDFELVSERDVLNHIYMFDVDHDVESCFSTGTWKENLYFWFDNAWKNGSTKMVTDAPYSNSPNVQFFGDVKQLADRISKSLAYSGVGYKVVVDEGVESEEKFISFDSKHVSEAIQEIYGTFKVPYYFDGRILHVGESKNVVNTPLRYGKDNALLSISKTNANHKIINRITGMGSDENIPYYYPNKSPKGDVSVAMIAGNKSLKDGDIIISNPELFCDKASASYEIKYSGGTPKINSVSYAAAGGDFKKYEPSSVVYKFKAMTFKFILDNPVEGTMALDLYIIDDKGGTSSVKYAVKDVVKSVVLKNLDGSECSYWVSKSERMLELVGNIQAGNGMELFVSVELPSEARNLHVTGKLMPSYQWQMRGRVVYLNDIGLRLRDGATPAVGDGFTQAISNYIIPSKRLMPPIYRESMGQQRFYNAENNKYDDEKGTKYEFKNPYSRLNPHEHIETFEDIKPTIEGVRNNGLRIDVFEEFAYDTNDNDEFDSKDGKYKHPYFFGKLRPLGFNLFDSSNEKRVMTVSMKSGQCGACEFQIGVGEHSDKNTVQIHEATGRPLRDPDTGDIICGRDGQGAQTPQEIQQDTTSNSVWIALKKDSSTYGNDELRPNNIFRPRSVVESQGSETLADKFVILGMNMPFFLVQEAERKLEKELIKHMYLNNDDKFTFEIKFSRIYLQEHREVREILDENSKLSIFYDGNLYPVYVDSYRYKVSEGDILPSIEVSVKDTLLANKSSLEEKLSDVKKDIVNTVLKDEYLSTLLEYFLEEGEKRFLIRNRQDSTNKEISLLGGAKIGEYKAGERGANVDNQGNVVAQSVRSNRYDRGILGGGFSLSTNPATGNSELEVDELFVRVRAVFNELQIRSIKYAGGEWIFSPAGMECKSVEEFSTYYRCYFSEKNKDSSVSVKNEFAVNDQVRCQEYNTERTDGSGNRNYWMRCINIGEDYIDLSKRDKSSTSNAYPMAGDTLVTLGNWSDAERQNAIIISTVGPGAPYFSQHKGIGVKHFNLDGTQKTLISPTKNIFSGEFIFSSGQNVEDRINEVNKEFNLGLGGVADRLEKIEKQNDGAIEFWFGSERPTLSNKPAVDWIKEGSQEKHLADMYYADDNTAWRFSKMENGTYCWKEVIDSEAKEALKTAKDALAAADGKVTVFLEQPTTEQEYKVGDLWINASYSDNIVTYKNDILRCRMGKEAGNVFQISHWVKAANYTDDTKAIEADKKAGKAQEDANLANQEAKKASEQAKITDKKITDILSDGVITPVEKRDIQKEFTIINDEYPNNQALAIKYGVSVDAYNASYVALEKELSIILKNMNENSNISSNNIVILFSNYYDSKTKMMNNISSKAKSLADGAQKTAEEARGVADKAKKDAEASKQLLDDILNDNKITPDEKINIQREWLSISSEYYKNTSNASLYDIDYSAYSEAFSTLEQIIDYILSSMESTTEVVYSDVFDTFSNYYIERDFILEEIAWSAEYLTSNAQKDATKAIENAQTAQSAADAAQDSANAAKNRLDGWADDDLISPNEKQSLKSEDVNITQEKTQINDAYAKYGMGTPTEYNAAYNLYHNNLVDLSKPTPENIPIPKDPRTNENLFAKNQNRYYSQRTACLNAIADATKEYAKEQVANVQVGGRNLIRKSEHVVIEESQLNWNSKSFHPTERIQSDKDYVLSVDSIKVLSGNPKGVSVFLFDLEHTGNEPQYYAKAVLEISDQKKYVLLHTSAIPDSKNLVVVIYCGIGGETAGNSIELNKIKFEEGNRPSSWTEAPEDTRENIRLAQEAADNAGTVAKGAADRLESWSKDGVISPNEKQAIRTEDINITQEKEQILSAYTKYGLEEPTVYITVYGNYHQNLVAMSAKEPEVITIPSVFAANQQEYYHQRTLCLNAISEATKHYAEQQAANVQVGGRNLVLDSEKGISGTYDSKFYDLNTTWKAMTGKEVTISFDYVYENLNTPPESDDSQRIGVEASIATKNGQNYDVRAWLFFYNNKKNLNGRGRFKRTAFVPTDIVDDNNVIGAHIQLPGSTATLVKVDHIKVEFGNRATDWTPAVEDVERNVNLAKEAADKAQKDADDANKKLTDWANDKLITPDERPSLKRELVNITAEKQQINDAYGKYGLGTPNGYNTAFTAYSTQLDTLSSSTNDSDPVPDTFESNQTAYYTQRTACLNAIADGTKKYSENLVGNVSVGGRNIIRNSKELTIEESPAIWNNKIFYPTERIRSNTDFVFSVESTKVLKGNPKGITVFLYDLSHKEGEAMVYASGVLDISNEKKHALLHTGKIPDDKNLVFIIYSGIAGETQGISVQFSKLKLEEGNKPTAWSEAPEDILQASYEHTNRRIENTETHFTSEFESVKTDISGLSNELIAEVENRKSAIEQTQKSITATVEGSIREINIGGRNLLLNSENIFFKDSDFPNVSDRGNGYISVNSSGLFNAYVALTNTELSAPVAARYYTFSIDVMVESGTLNYVKLFLDGWDSSQFVHGEYVELENNRIWKRFGVTIDREGTNINKFVIGISSLNGSANNNGVLIRYRNIKIEEGNKPTGWSPAPEDIDAEFAEQGKLIELNKAQIKVTQDSINANVQKVGILEGKLSDAESQITQTAEKIETNVQKTEEINGRLSTAESTIKQLPDQIELEVSSIEVGGRNYLTNSSLEEQEDWKINDPIHAAFTTSQYGKCLVSYAKSAGAYKYIDKPVSSNVYVSSVDVFSQDGGKHSIYLGMELPDNSFLKEYDLTPGTWTRISNVQILDSERRAFIIYGDDSMLLFRNAQLEAGNKPTSWKESSEDTEEKLLKTGIDIKNGQIDVTANKFKVQDSNGTPVAVFTTENGTPQVKAENIQADNIIASRLISTGIDGTKTEVIGGIFSCFAPNSPTPGIKIGIDADGDLVFKFYDKNGKETFNFGPKGPLEIRTPYMDATNMALITSVNNPTYQNVSGNIKSPKAVIYFQYQSGSLEGIGDSRLDGYYYQTKGLSGSQVPSGAPIPDGWYTLNVGEPFYLKVDKFDVNDLKPEYAKTGQYYYMRNIIKIISGGPVKIGNKILTRKVYWQ